MFAVGMLRGKPGVHSLEVPAPEINEPDEVLVRMKEVGLDGTDFNIVRYNLQDIAEGRNEIVLGHEGIGVVEAVGSAVKTLAPGDLVSITVRRGCGHCEPCLHNQSDMCMTGLFTERGIHKMDGLLTQYVVDKEQYMVKVPPQIRKLAVFTEPLSIVEKGVEQIRVIQSRLPWYCPHVEHGLDSPEWGGCKVALVVGAGPLGLLATALIRLARTITYTTDIVPEDHPKVHLLGDMGATYVDARAKTPEQIVDFCCTPIGELNMIFEASGAADTALKLIPFMSRSSIYVMTGIPRGDLKIELDAAQLVRQVVRYNQVVVGSVNSNRRHFEMALGDIARINESFSGMLDEMVSRRLPLEDYAKAFTIDDPRHIKTVMEIEPW
ncbi:MAG: alcohol dehydrogenase catalytic domain-containing protein [Chloroflexi bacterium]|nr:alcohol dehydrogenase catalytic domain-containing protein [Chloroflexota bacterium]